MIEATRREIECIRPKIEEAVRRESFEDFKNILILELKLALGSEKFRSYESSFWQAVAEKRSMKQRR